MHRQGEHWNSPSPELGIIVGEIWWNLPAVHIYFKKCGSHFSIEIWKKLSNLSRYLSKHSAFLVQTSITLYIGFFNFPVRWKFSSFTFEEVSVFVQIKPICSKYLKVFHHLCRNKEKSCKLTHTGAAGQESQTVEY